MMMLSVPFDYSECQGFSFHTVTFCFFSCLTGLAGYLAKRGARSKSLHFEGSKTERERDFSKGGEIKRT